MGASNIVPFSFSFIRILYLSCILLAFHSSAEELGTECLKVPNSDFVSSLKTTLDTIRDVTSVVSQFTGVFGGGFRVSNAVNDCLDLLDLSADEVDWTMSSSQTPGLNGKANSLVRQTADMRTWLGAALSNQETCVDGFDGTNGIVKSLVAGSLNQLSSLVSEVLGMVKQVPNSDDFAFSDTNAGGGRARNGAGSRKNLDVGNGFPHWLKRKERKLLQATTGISTVADAVVAQDGSGNFTKIVDAIDAVPNNSTKRFVIYIKKGVYNEYVEIGKKKSNVMMIGDGMTATVITGNRNFIDGWTTYRSATFAVKGKGFVARDIGFENTAGPSKHQAVAFRSDSDLSVIYRCAITGYQDTLYAHSMRQFYRECVIKGTVDFIFGDATMVLQNCVIQTRIGLSNQKNTVTAQGRKEPTQPSGFTLQFCNITSEGPVVANSTMQNYLGRPWKQYSRTVIMQSYISAAIRPEGWLEWNGNFALDTLYYGEFMNYGSGSGLSGRVNWTGFHAINNSSQANSFTVAQFLLGNDWLPSTGVKYTAGLGV